MKVKNYIDKNGFVYGVSSKYNFGRWNHVLYIFHDEETAYKWLHTEEHDFRERELCSKTTAIKYVGREGLKEAIDWKRFID